MVKNIIKDVNIGTVNNEEPPYTKKELINRIKLYLKDNEMIVSLLFPDCFKKIDNILEDFSYTQLEELYDLTFD